MKIRFVSHVSFVGTKFTFKTEIIEFAEDVKINRSESESITINIDPASQPLYSLYSGPGGGWVTPAMSEPDDPEFSIVKCRCQKEADQPGDKESLESTGHRADCPRKPTPTAQSLTIAQPAHTTPPPPLGGNGAVAPNGLPRRESIPPGGLSEVKLQNLIGQLHGDDGNTGLEQAIATVERDKAALAKIDPLMVSRQLVRDFNFSQCVSCGIWNDIINAADPRCYTCAGSAGKGQ
jgi:hypothetical protein